MLDDKSTRSQLETIDFSSFGSGKRRMWYDRVHRKTTNRIKLISPYIWFALNYLGFFFVHSFVKAKEHIAPANLKPRQFLNHTTTTKKTKQKASMV